MKWKDIYSDWLGVIRFELDMPVSVVSFKTVQVQQR